MNYSKEDLVISSINNKGLDKLCLEILHLYENPSYFMHLLMLLKMTPLISLTFNDFVFVSLSLSSNCFLLLQLLFKVIICAHCKSCVTTSRVSPISNMDCRPKDTPRARIRLSSASSNDDDRRGWKEEKHEENASVLKAKPRIKPWEKAPKGSALEKRLKRERNRKRSEQRKRAMMNALKRDEEEKRKRKEDAGKGDSGKIGYGADAFDAGAIGGETGAIGGDAAGDSTSVIAAGRTADPAVQTDGGARPKAVSFNAVGDNADDDDEWEEEEEEEDDAKMKERKEREKFVDEELKKKRKEFRAQVKELVERRRKIREEGQKRKKEFLESAAKRLKVKEMRREEERKEKEELDEMRERRKAKYQEECAKNRAKMWTTPLSEKAKEAAAAAVAESDDFALDHATVERVEENRDKYFDFVERAPQPAYTEGEMQCMSFKERLEKCHQIRFTTVAEAMELAKEWKKDFPLQLAEAWRSLGLQPHPMIHGLWAVVQRNKLNRRTLRQIWVAAGEKKEVLDQLAVRALQAAGVPDYSELSFNQLQNVADYAKKHGEAVVPRISHNRRRREDQYTDQEVGQPDWKHTGFAKDTTIYDGATEASRIERAKIEKREKMMARIPRLPPTPGEGFSLEKRD